MRTLGRESVPPLAPRLMIAVAAVVAIVCSLGASPATAAPAPGSSFFGVSPCRVLDTRLPAGLQGGPALGPNEVRLFPISGTCGIPLTTTAVSGSLIAINPGASGLLRVFPGDIAEPVTNTITFGAGQTRAGNGLFLLATDGSGTLAVHNVSPGPVDFVFDVNGYFDAGCPPITLNPSTIPSVADGTPVNATLTASGGNGPYTFAVTSGALPAGVTLSPAGLLSGTATASGSFNFTATATDFNNCTGARAYTLLVTCPTITVSPTTLSQGALGVPYGPVTFTQTGAVGGVTWTFTGTLPTGMTLSGAGVLSGTPTQGGTFPITVIATDAGGCSGSVNVTLSTCPTVTVTNPATAAATAGSSFSQTFTQAGGALPVAFTLATGALPAGLTLAANGTLSGTPTQTGTFPITVTATDTNGCAGTGSPYPLVVSCGTVTVTNPGVASGTAGTPFSQPFTQTGGIGAVTFSLASGTLPSGLALASNGMLSGTPTQTGSFPITVKATDANTCNGTGATYTLVIGCPPIVVSISPAPAQVCSGSAGNSASATPGFASYSWSIANGTIQGSTTGASISYTAGPTGNVGLTVNVTNASACPGLASLNVPITAIPSPPVIAASNPQKFTVSGAAGSFTLTFNGQTTGALAFNASAASVQAALNALSSIGGVGGTAAVTQAANVYTVTFGGSLADPQPQLTASGAGGCTVTVDAPAVCADSAGNLARGPAGATSYTWVITNGTITSVANVQTITYTAGPSGTVKLDLTVTNPGGCTAKNSLDVTINAVPAAPTIIPTPSRVCGDSTGNTAAGPAGASTYAWSITNGTIALGGSSQTVTYTAGPSGNVGLTLTVTNAPGCSAQNTLDVPIDAAPATPTITPTPVTVCSSVSGNTAAGPAGATTYAWSITNGTITSLSNIQTITYTAGASGNVGLTLVVTNAQSCLASNTLDVPINPVPAFTPAAGALSIATFNAAYSLTFAGTGGTAPYTFALAGGALPAGMTLNSNGTVSPNTPSATGTFAFSITVSDAKGCSSAQAYTLNVQPNLQPDAYSGVGNTQLFITGVSGSPTAPAVSNDTTALANDTPIGGIAVTAGTTACGGIGGSITIDSAGRFIYTPLVGTTGLATCSYTGTSNTIPATGTINITLNGMVWYVNNASGAGGADSASRGRSHEPLLTIGQAVTNSSIDQTIFLHSGSSSYAGTSLNKAGLTLWGQGTTFTLPPLTIASGGKPTIGSTLTLAANTLTVSSLNVSAGASTGITNTGTRTGLTIKNNVAVTTTTSTAVSFSNVDSTAGGAPNNGINFRSVSSDGAANGISLAGVNVSTGSFAVTGDGTNNSSGGTIQNATVGVLLSNARNISLTSMNIQNTTQSGIDGQNDVTNFSFVNGTINNSGTSGTLGGGNTYSNIGFNANPATAKNLEGTLTVTGSTFTNAWFSGVDVQAGDGTLASATISNNTITSPTSASTSQGQGINFVGVGSASTTFSLGKATIANNTIRNFPSGAGIQVNLSNANASGPRTTAGIPGDAANIVSITGNDIQGLGAIVPMNTSAIIFAVSGANPGSRSRGNADISNNGTIGTPLSNMVGTAILVGINGNTTATVTTNGNVIAANNSFGSQGIGGGNGISNSSADTPDLTWTILNNVISATDGNGILAVGRGVTGSLKARIQGNTVAAPLGGVRPGIRVDAGNASSVNDSVCLNISGNTSAGSGGTQGIGLRKQGTVPAVNAFGVNGMAATGTPGVETYVNGLNPAGGGTLLISATAGFTNCSLP